MTNATGRERTACTQGATPGVLWAVECGQFPSHTEQSEKARKLLERLAGFLPTVEHDASGAPCIAGHPELHISISHCAKAVAVAVSTKQKVGIDIESRRKVGDSLMERVCTPDELDKIRRSDDPEMAFLRCWTRKEAVLKCRGTGIKGFGSMVEASKASDCNVEEVDCGQPGVVAALATAL